MRVDLFDFELPEGRIALRPARPRDAARLLVVRPPDDFADRRVSDLPTLLRPGDLVVVNDTKVIPAVLRGRRERGERAADVSITLAKDAGAGLWEGLARPAKRLRAGDVIAFGSDGSLRATIAENEGEGRVRLAFDRSGAALRAALMAVGNVPLPPYIAARRPEDEEDQADYQTVYARSEGAIAAPTAGLHFTPALLERLTAAGIQRADVTLHVGPGTFVPVKADDTENHVPLPEAGVVTPATAEQVNAARKAGGRVLAVGTTVARLLEAATDASGLVAPFAGETGLFITPGYRFRTVDLLMTNFHLPRSTLLMLVSAFSGLLAMQAAYRHAIAAGYRFYSYGDACLLHPERSL